MSSRSGASRPRTSTPSGRRAGRRAVASALIAAGVLGLAPAAADAAYERTTFLLSRSFDGGFPDGTSRNAAVSHDQRIARIMAFESDATNILPGDTNGTTDVFVVNRGAPWGKDGTPWAIGSTELVSVGMDGQPADGPSTLPSLDGDSHHVPHCVAFVSEASNLVPGDTNGVADAFVRDLRTGKTTRVSVDSKGRQADGPTSEVSIDGACERVAFTAQATNLAGRAPDRLKARAAQAPAKQVYVHVLNASGHDRGFKGLTFLASASQSGAPGNADSWQPAFGRAGKTVVFTSNASNLTRGDSNGASDVYQRSFKRDFHKGKQTLTFSTRLVSATSSGRAGNGPSSNPDSSDDGRYVAYETQASNLLADDTNGVSDIVEADLGGKRVRQQWVSKSKATTIGNGASHNPTISGAGEFVLFDSDASNLKEGPTLKDDANGVRDMFLWNRPTGNVSLESRGAPPAPGVKGAYLDVPSEKPATSSRGNYVAFETTNTVIDLPLLAQLAVHPPVTDIGFVYVRYLGEK